jgi:hypothetical protein
MPKQGIGTLYSYIATKEDILSIAFHGIAADRPPEH